MLNGLDFGKRIYPEYFAMNDLSQGSAASAESKQGKAGNSFVSTAGGYLLPIGSSVASGFLLAPYTATVVRSGFPYAYGYITGVWPEELSYLHYASLYLPMREHATNVAYQNSYLIGMAAGTIAYYTAKITYLVSKEAVKKAGSGLGSLYSFFNKGKSEQRELTESNSDLTNKPVNCLSV